MKGSEPRTTTLPTELWLIIFDLVIQDGIIQVDQCDHTKFPYIQYILSAVHLHYRSYDSYWRLRLVCRRFRAILGDPPSQILSPSSTFPLSTTIRAAILDLDAWPGTDFQLHSAERLSCRRLVYLDVTCGLVPSSDRPNLSDFLRKSAGRAFHNIQRLTLRIWNNRRSAWYEESFWVRLQDAFPLLVTLVITQENPGSGNIILEPAARVALFEWLEILHLGRAIKYAGCRFFRLRHASMWRCSRDELKILTNSSHLESLLIRLPYTGQLDVYLCSRLKLLGIPDALCHQVALPQDKHPLEHLWIVIDNLMGYYRSIMELLKKAPRISRVTIQISPSISEQGRTQIIQDLQEIDFLSIGMNMRPGVGDDSLLVIERSAAPVGV
jgi:hypothetical protein